MSEYLKMLYPDTGTAIFDAMLFNAVSANMERMLSTRFNHAVKDAAGQIVCLTSCTATVSSMRRRTRGKAVPAKLYIVH